jgi:cell division protein FtsX
VLTLLTVAFAAACDDGTDTAAGPREVPRLANEDAEVYLDLSATPKQITAIRRVIRRTAAVDRFAYLDRKDAVREFARLFPNERNAIATTAAGDLPPSFRVTFSDPEGLRTLRRSLRGMSGYDGTVDHSRSERLDEQSLADACEMLVRSQAVDVDAEVFMQILSTPEQQDAVRARLERAPEIQRIVFVSQEDAFRLFRRMFQDQPKVLADASPDSLPVSYRVWFRSGADPSGLLSELGTTAGVDEVTVADTGLRERCRGA